MIHKYTPVSQTRWDPRPTGKISPKFVPGGRKLLKFCPHWEKWSITIPTVKFWSEFAVPTGFLDWKQWKQISPGIKLKRFFIPTWIFALNLIPTGYEISTGSMRQGCFKSCNLLHSNQFRSLIWSFQSQLFFH